jgi:hypothetical protein
METDWLYVVHEKDWSAFAVFADAEDARRASADWFGSNLIRVPPGAEVRDWVLNYPKAANAR